MIYLVIVTIIAFVIIVKSLQKKSNNIEKFIINDAILNNEELLSHAKVIAKNHSIINKKKNYNFLFDRLHQNYNYILEVYKKLNSDASKQIPLCPASEWVLDNFYIIEEQYKELKLNVSRSNSLGRLNILNTGTLRGYPRIFALSLELISHTDGRIDKNQLIEFIDAYQGVNLLSTAEIWSLSIMIRLSIMEKIRYVCEKLQSTQLEWERLYQQHTDSMLKTQEQLESYVHDMKVLNSSYIEHMLNILKKEDFNSEELLSIVSSKLTEFDTNIEQVVKMEHQEQAGLQITMGNCITSLRVVNSLDWEELFENMSILEKILKTDPAGVYPDQDFESRDFYRHRIELLAKKYNISETKIARCIMNCCHKAIANNEEFKNTHIGYYILGDGQYELKNQLSPHKLTNTHKKFTPTHYILLIVALSILLAIFTVSFIYPSSFDKNYVILSLLFILFWFPSSDIIISLINKLFTKLIPPSFLPKLDFKTGIPAECSTIVLTPTLISNQKRAEELISEMESSYLANNEKNIYFCLLGDLKDSVTESNKDDEALILYVKTKIKTLNDKYAKEHDIFYSFIRKRYFHEERHVWTGYERKRGAITEFNNYLRSESINSFYIMNDSTEFLKKCKYIITLDADTIIPIGTAKKLIGTIAHPINKAKFDSSRGIVVTGYGLIQPRIDLNIISSNKSIFSRIFAGRGGIDTYTNAISDVYADMFEEGIFTGKGIYDIDIYRSSLNTALPDNRVLSHDLLEGSYLRVGLATDITLIDSYPEKYNSYIMRLHRWTRGDWQLLWWLLPRIRNKSGARVKNPISALSKWKIFDNMRRSLVPISLMFVFIFSMLFTPADMLLWVGFALFTIFLPLITTFLEYIKISPYKNLHEKLNGNLIFGLKGIFYETLLTFLFLPYFSYMMADAILRTVYRVSISKKRLLEWVTASDTERTIRNDKNSYILRMLPSLSIIYLVFLISLIINPGNLYFPLMLILLWSFSPYLAYKISKPAKDEPVPINEAEQKLIRSLARKTWSFYEEFSGAYDNFLPPDNFQLSPIKRTAHRTSPTNIGLLMASTLSAFDLGYISIPGLINRLSDIVATIEKLEKWNGHLYNWYDTRTLKILTPKYISTVDSGNFIGYLIAINEGLLTINDTPLWTAQTLLGLEDTIYVYGRNSKISELRLDNSLQSDSLVDKIYKNLALCNEFTTSENNSHTKIANFINTLTTEIQTYFPIFSLTDNEYSDFTKSDFFEDVDKILTGAKKHPSTNNLLSSYDKLLQLLKEKNKSVKKETPLSASLAKLIAGYEAAELSIKQICGEIDLLKEALIRFIHSTSFTPLYEPKVGLFSIGYNIDENKLTNSFYDLLASESRITSYIAVARREVPVSHWFRLGRSLALIDGYKSLVSWTGTMFEYFMPPLIMKVFKNTLLDETYHTVLKAQIKYGKYRNVPWGTSESGFYTFDLMLNYQYKAFGVPELGLKRGLINDMVVSPYSTILGLPFLPRECLENIELLLKNDLEGEYGFYEAVDYTPERLSDNNNHAVVQSFMAHHQGMIMVSLNNYINNNIMVDRFHSNPLIKAGEFLLQERIPMRVLITKEHKELVTPLLKPEFSTPTFTRLISKLDKAIPECHMLSNGTFTSLITSRGSGFSRRDDVYLNRWREDITNHNYGNFIFIKDVENQNYWSAFYAPFNELNDKYEVKFSPDKAEFFRSDFNIDTHTEICVSPEDNCEIRKLTITNNSPKAVVLEITSYLEITLSNLAADIVHPTFNNLFVRTELHRESNGIIAWRRPREEGKKSLFSYHSIGHNNNFIGNIEYECDRSRFIGRGNSLSNATAFTHPLNCSIGAVLDPIISIRTKIQIDTGKNETISFISGIADSHDLSVEAIKKYSENANIHRAFELAYIRSQMSSKYLNLKNSDVDSFDHMLSSMIFLSPQRKNYSKFIQMNQKGQSGLWEHGISGDLPIMLVSIKLPENIDMVKKMINAHAYYKTKGLRSDLIIINEEEASYNAPLQSMIKDMVLTSNSRDILEAPGGIFIKNLSQLKEEDLFLFYSAARVIINAELGNIKSQIKNIIIENQIPQLETKRLSYEVAFSNDITPELSFFNSYGGFNKNDNGYTILLNDNTKTPAPWINVISNKSFGFTISESGAGFTWADNSRENKLSTWSNDAVSDTPSEIIYLRNDATGNIFSPTPLPIREKEPYKIVHNMGHTTFSHKSNGVAQTYTTFVPVESEKIKISIVTLENLSTTTQELSVFHYIRPVLGVSEQFSEPFICSEKLNAPEAILLKNSYNSDFKNNIVFLSGSLNQYSFTCDRQEFFGSSGTLDSPGALKNEKLSGAAGAGFYPCGAIQYKTKLKPSETVEFVLLLGSGGSMSEISSLCNKYHSLKACKAALEKVKTFWKNLLGTITVTTPEPSIDLMLNSWLSYQTIVCRLWARSGFYQSGGAYGFRDQLQDVLSIINLLPEEAKEQIILHCAHQFTDGDVQHWWHPGTNNKGIRTKFSDDLLWLPYTLAEYVEKTNDKKLLRIEVPFLTEPPLKEHEDERYGIPQVANETGSVYEHCIRAIERAIKFGSHGIPLMGSGDWNDGMNTVGNKGQGESIWMGWFLCSVLTKFSVICKHMNDLERSKKYLKIADEISANIDANAWDGQWYRRAYFDDGTPLGSSMNNECKIDSLAQTWAVISGYGNNDKIKTAIGSLENYLINKDSGLILLFTPPFDNGELKPGYIKGYVPGVRENGGQYTHAATWVVMAFARMGLGDKAVEYFKLINPINHSNTQLECARYKVEPYVMAADVYSLEPHSGRGGWTWYTGSSGWMYKIGIEEILGFTKRGDKLSINPCIPHTWSEYSITYNYEGSVYNIRVLNPNKVSTGIHSVTVDGILKPDKQISLMNKKSEYAVEIIMG